MKINLDPIEIRSRIDSILREDLIIPKHNEHGHFYEINENDHPIYPSVTGKLQILKDEGLINYKMNRAIEYIFANFKKFTEENIMEHLDIASRVSQDILVDAGDVGRRIHDIREKIFKDHILTGKRPDNFLSYIPEEITDIRITSAIRALQKFCIDYDYIPIKTELLVYNHDLKVAGTLDDLGIITNKEGKRELVLLDVKTSNAFKDHYFFQVSLYWWMFHKLIGIKPTTCFILKLSKEDGMYKIEDLKRPAKLAQYARHMLKTNEAVEFIKSLRKDNQKIVIKI